MLFDNLGYLSSGGAEGYVSILLTFGKFCTLFLRPMLSCEFHTTHFMDEATEI
jgi:hypothetical protein